MEKHASNESRQILPSHRELCVVTPLYTGFKVGKPHEKYLSDLRTGEVQFDAYCVECKKESTFRDTRPSGSGAGLPARPRDWMFKDGEFATVLTCARRGHRVIYIFLMANKLLQKIGQHPSVEDVVGADLKRFRSVLMDDDFRELRRATGLASHGIGIGSFVYLRRIFERMIHRHHDELAKAGSGVDAFNTMRIDEKIGALADVLPAALVKNKAVYRILSKGIHELDEDTCKRYFRVVRAAIIHILEKDLQVRQEKLAEEELSRQLQRIASEANSSASPSQPDED